METLDVDDFDGDRQCNMVSNSKESLFERKVLKEAIWCTSSCGEKHNDVVKVGNRNESLNNCCNQTLVLETKNLKKILCLNRRKGINRQVLLKVSVGKKLVAMRFGKLSQRVDFKNSLGASYF
jgi:hypothetical protein